MVKKQARKIYSDKRIHLSDNDIEDLTGKIVDQFATIALNGAQWLLSYYPIPERKEFSVTICEQLMMLENETLQIAWPVLSADDFTMEAVSVNKQTELVKNRFDIYEPKDGELIDAQLIDVAFVPLLAFDTKGYRVGYGKGFYDRFLQRCAQDVVKIGFSYFEAIDTIEDINQFDVPLNYCITPMRVYEF